MAQRCRFRDFQGIHYECSLVLSWFFIEPSTLNHFTPFRRFEKFGYSHLSAASFQPNGIADFERHSPFPPIAGIGREICALLAWPPSPSE
jgi:hypothetical protein